MQKMNIRKADDGGVVKIPFKSSTLPVESLKSTFFESRFKMHAPVLLLNLLIFL